MDLPEIIAEVCECLSDDQQSLAPISRVSNQWRAFAQPILFRTFEHYPTDSTKRLLAFAAAVSTRHELAKRVKTLSADFDVATLADIVLSLPIILESCGDIKELRISQLPSCQATDPILQEILHLSNLKKLRLDYAYIFMSPIGQYDVAGAAPVFKLLENAEFQLTHLRLAGIAATYSEIMPLPIKALSTLTSLSLSSVGLSDSQLLALLQSLPRLVELSISSIEEAAQLLNPLRAVSGSNQLCEVTASGLCEILRPIMPRLKTFRLCVSSITFDETSLERLADLVKFATLLKTLAIEVQALPLPTRLFDSISATIEDLYVCADYPSYGSLNETNFGDSTQMTLKWISSLPEQHNLRSLKVNSRKFMHAFPFASSTEFLHQLEKECSRKNIRFEAVERGYARFWT